MCSPRQQDFTKVRAIKTMRIVQESTYGSIKQKRESRNPHIGEDRTGFASQ